MATGGKRGEGRTDTGEPITGRDLIALLATIGVDIGLLVLAILNPPQEAPSVRPTGPLRRQINEAIDTAINTAVARAGANREWVHRHFIHHHNASYLVIPNLYAADPANEQESAKALALNHLVGVLSDLGLVRWPRRWEGRRLRKEEGINSGTDLRQIRQQWRKQQHLEALPGAPSDDRPIRNHGLFSKAERALEVAGWSERARNDIEVFRLADTEGLTPVLMVLNERGGPAPNGHAAPASEVPAS